jgi:hypothetical protein
MTETIMPSAARGKAKAADFSGKLIKGKKGIVESSSFISVTMCKFASRLSERSTYPP